MSALTESEDGGTRSRSRSPTATSMISECPFLTRSQSSRDLPVPIEDIIRQLVHETLGLPKVDVSPFVAILEQNLIVNSHTLARLSPSLLPRLNLPIGLENELLRFVSVHSPASTPARPRRTMKRQSGRKIEMADKSPLLGLTVEMRQTLKDSWAMVCSQKPNAVSSVTTSTLNQFFDSFYKNFLEIDKVGKNLFQNTSMITQARALMRIMTFIMQSIDNPEKLIIPLKKMGCRHMIYGCKKRNFTSFGIALAKTFEQVLGPEQCSPAVKEAWFMLVQTLGEIMMSDYEDIKTGYAGKIYKKEGSKWKMYYTVLTHDRLSFFRDEAREKVREELDLTILDSIDLEEDELIQGKVAKVTPFCFSLTSASTIKTYFCTDSEDDLLTWTTDLTERIKAHQRVAQSEIVSSGDKLEGSDDSDDGAKSSASRSKVSKAATTVQKLKKYMK